MSRYNAIKLALMAVFLAVLIGGAIFTAGNAKRWSVSVGAVTKEYVGEGSLKYALAHAAGTDADEAAAGAESTLSDEDLAYGEGMTAGDNAVRTGEGTPGTDTEDTYPGESGGAADSATGRDGSGADPDPGTGDLGSNAVNNDSDKADKDFYISEITDEIFARINGRSYPEGCPVELSELRYIHVLHTGFDGRMHVGEIIVNAGIAADVLDIFRELYKIGYPIEKMRLIDEYDADDERSMEDNNSSGFCYRTVAGSTALSRHAYGMAIDINPFYNPYYYTKDDGTEFLQPKGSEKYLDRTSDEKYLIKQGDDCYRIFTSHGFTWGGEWTTKKDYQHFEH